MDSNYFISYEDLNVHRLMLTDVERVRSYKEAIFSNRELFKNSTVLDVGAGTGVLSIFAAQAGAKKVYSVEAATNLIPIMKALLCENECTEIIEVVEGEIEKIDLPEKVDIIISEWMGFFLLNEGMLDSVLYAKKFLKEGGVMFPEECKMFVALCELPEYYDNWDNVEGIKMSSFGEILRRADVSEQPAVTYINKQWLLSDQIEIFSFKPIESEINQFLNITAKHVVPINRNGKYQGLCIWFDVQFPTPSGNIILSTSPYVPETHWKQTVIVFPSEIIVEKGEPVAFEIEFNKVKTRKYQIAFSMLDSDEMEHPSPCDCYMTKCELIKAFLSGTVDNC